MQAFSKGDTVGDVLRWSGRFVRSREIVSDTGVHNLRRREAGRGMRCECAFCAIVMVMTLALSRLYIHVVGKRILGTDCGGVVGGLEERRRAVEVVIQLRE